MPMARITCPLEVDRSQKQVSQGAAILSDVDRVDEIVAERCGRPDRRIDDGVTESPEISSIVLPMLAAFKLGHHIGGQPVPTRPNSFVRDARKLLQRHQMVKADCAFGLLNALGYIVCGTDPDDAVFL